MNNGVFTPPRWHCTDAKQQLGQRNAGQKKILLPAGSANPKRLDALMVSFPRKQRWYREQSFKTHRFSEGLVTQRVNALGFGIRETDTAAIYSRAYFKHTIQIIGNNYKSLNSLL